MMLMLTQKELTHFDFLILNLSVSNENSPTLSYGEIFMTVFPHCYSSFSAPHIWSDTRLLQVDFS